MTNSPLNSTKFIEDFVEKNKDALEQLENNKEFMNWYSTLKESETVNQSMNQELFSYMFGDEYIPGEQQDDEFTYLDNRYQRPIGSKLLRAAGKTEGARLIKNRRALQFTEFAKPSRKDKEPGLAIKFRNPDYKPTLMEKQAVLEFNQQFVDKFFFPPFSKKGNFMGWLGTAYADWFDLDDITNEIRRSGTGMPLGMHITDPTLVYHVLPNKKVYDRWDKNAYSNKSAPRYPKAEISYLIIKNNVRIAALDDNRMIKSHFFVSSDFNEAYRGFSIVEQGIKMLSNIVNSITYNSSNFSNNRTPMGILALTGGQVNQLTVEKFKKLLYSYLSGAANRYRIPVVGLPERGDAKFIPFNMNSREMEFHLWMTLLMTILCQLSGTNPEEISMSSHESAMTGKKLFDQAPDGILQVSRDTGLNTFLRYIEQIINKSEVLKQMTGLDIKCEFNGLVVENEKAKTDLITTKLTSVSSLNEIITESGGEPQTLNIGDINVYDVVAINNPQVQAAIQSQLEIKKEKQQAEMQAQQMAEQANTPDEKIKQQYGEPVE